MKDFENWLEDTTRYIRGDDSKEEGTGKTTPARYQCPGCGYLVSAIMLEQLRYPGITCFRGCGCTLEDYRKV